MKQVEQIQADQKLEQNFSMEKQRSMKLEMVWNIIIKVININSITKIIINQ